MVDTANRYLSLHENLPIYENKSVGPEKCGRKILAQIEAYLYMLTGPTHVFQQLAFDILGANCRADASDRGGLQSAERGGDEAQSTDACARAMATSLREKTDRPRQRRPRGGKQRPLYYINHQGPHRRTHARHFPPPSPPYMEMES